MFSKSATGFRLKKGLFALALSALSFSSAATFPDVDSMLQSYRPIAQIAAPQIYTLTLALDAARPFGQTRQDILLTLVPLADGSLWAASEGPMRQVNSAIHDRLLLVMESTESGYTSGDPMKALQQGTKKLPPEVKSETPAKSVEATTHTIKPAEQPNHENKEEPAEKSAEIPAEKPTDNTPHQDNPDVPIEEPVKYQDLSKVHDIKGAWIQVLGDDIRQQNTEGTPGYHAQVLGAVIGRDLEIGPRMIMGVAGGYQQADVDQIGFSGSFLDIKRLHGTVYGRYHLQNCPIYMQGTLTFAHNRYDNSRLLIVPPYNGQGFVGYANADFTGWETDVYLETGIMNKLNKFRFTPKLFLNYAHLDVHGYKEADMFALNLNVKYEHMDALSLGTGAKLDYHNEFENVDVVPEAHAYVLYDFINDAQVATANFLGGGYTFLSQGPTPNAITYEVGAALAVHSHTNTTIKLQYDLAARSDYFRQGVFIKIRHEWV